MCFKNVKFSSANKKARDTLTSHLQEQMKGSAIGKIKVNIKLILAYLQFLQEVIVRDQKIRHRDICKIWDHNDRRHRREKLEVYCSKTHRIYVK